MSAKYVAERIIAATNSASELGKAFDSNQAMQLVCTVGDDWVATQARKGSKLYRGQMTVNLR
jgi:hypothetical protein